MIHETIDSRDGRTYKVVSRNWVRLMTALNIVGLVAAATLAYFLMTNIQVINEVRENSDKAKQRARAQAMLTRQRADIQVFSYNKACAFAKDRGESCLLDPQWWVDRQDFPLIANDPYWGDGLFGPQQEVGK